MLGYDRMRTAPRRPLRGALLLAAVAALWAFKCDFLFTVPVLQSTRQAEGLTVASRDSNAAWAQGNFAGRPQRATNGQISATSGKLGHDARATSPASMLLAAAGAAVAMRAAAAAGGAAKEEESFVQKYSVFGYIGLWYLFNIGYNIYNKKALIEYPFPWAVALFQMAFGFLIFVPLWVTGVRKAPRLSISEAITISPSAFGHLATHVGAVLAFFAGAVSFGHIVKASEPVVSSILNFLFMGEVMPWQVYASLLPIIGGVGLASASELSFNWLCFGAAMGSNIGSAARGVYSKKVMSGKKIGENMDSANIYAVLTIMATAMLIPISLAIEGPTAMIKGFQAAHAKFGTKFLLHLFYSGFYYYMYNEVAFQALGKLDPVSHAVANTMKRVVIIITAIIVFNTPVTPLGIAGSSIAIGGTLLYSLAKNTFKK